MNHPAVEEFIAAIGKDPESQELQTIFSKVGIQLEHLDEACSGRTTGRRRAPNWLGQGGAIDCMPAGATLGGCLTTAFV